MDELCFISVCCVTSKWLTSLWPTQLLYTGFTLKYDSEQSVSSLVCRYFYIFKATSYAVLDIKYVWHEFNLYLTPSWVRGGWTHFSLNKSCIIYVWEGKVWWSCIYVLDHHFLISSQNQRLYYRSKFVLMLMPSTAWRSSVKHNVFQCCMELFRVIQQKKAININRIIYSCT